MEMSAQITHRLSIETILPKKLVEGESCTIMHRIRNIGTIPFVGGTVVVRMSWPSLGGAMYVNHPLVVSKTLQPQESVDIRMVDTPATSGMTIFTLVIAQANDANPIEMFLPNGNLVGGGMVIGGGRARGQEEISQIQSVQVTAVSLVILVVFQIVDWAIRYLYRF